MNVNIGDRVTTPQHGPGVIINIEKFDVDGSPYYETERQEHVPPSLHRWGVLLDTEAGMNYTDGIAYFINGELKHEST